MLEPARSALMARMATLAIAMTVTSVVSWWPWGRNSSKTGL